MPNTKHLQRLSIDTRYVVNVDYRCPIVKDEKRNKSNNAGQKPHDSRQTTRAATNQQTAETVEFRKSKSVDCAMQEASDEGRVMVVTKSTTILSKSPEKASKESSEQPQEEQTSMMVHNLLPNEACITELPRQIADGSMSQSEAGNLSRKQKKKNRKQTATVDNPAEQRSQEEPAKLDQKNNQTRSECAKKVTAADDVMQDDDAIMERPDVDGFELVAHHHHRKDKRQASKSNDGHVTTKVPIKATDLSPHSVATAPAVSGALTAAPSSGSKKRKK